MSLVEGRTGPSLDRWIIDGQIPDHCYTELFEDPRFPEACRALSLRMLEAAARDKAVDGMVKDAGRYAAATWTVYLHVTGGLTLPRLKELCRASGILSPGRARALLLYLQYLGYVRAAPSVGGETRLYWPTAALRQAWRLTVERSISAVAIFEPAIDPMLKRLDEPLVLETFLRVQGEGFLATAIQVDQTTPFIQIFLHRHAGMQFLHLMLSEAGPDEVFPPRGGFTLSIASIARRLNVSRAHIRRLINDACKAGLMSQNTDGAISLTEAGRQSVRHLFAMRLIGFLICAAKAARRLPETGASLPSETATPLPEGRNAISRSGASA